MTATIWCKDHVPTKTIVHHMHDIVDESGLNALQLYVQNFKQADLTLTGTVRKATLVNQSTKVANISQIAPTPNRRTSTTTNGTTTSVRGSIAHVKADDGAGIMYPNTNSSLGKSCVTCQIGFSPKWWPFPSNPPTQPTVAPVVASIELNGSTQELEHPVAVISAQESLGTCGETHAALAAAALYQNNGNGLFVPTEFQCHQCHWKKIKKEPTPPPPEVRQQQQPVRPQVRASPSVVHIPTPDREILQPLQSPYSWQVASTYPQNGISNGSSYGWSRQSPSLQNVGPVSHVNGHQSPQVSMGAVQAPLAQSQVRQPAQGPHQNGHVPHMPQAPNGYPPSPHRGIGPAAVHVQASSYPSHSSSRIYPQHLTNGGPPPRAPERPFSQTNTSMHHPPFNSHQGSPPITRDIHTHSRESSNGQNNSIRPSDGRVNGGASASPSLRNLLS